MISPKKTLAKILYVRSVQEIFVLQLLLNRFHLGEIGKNSFGHIKKQWIYKKRKNGILRTTAKNEKIENATIPCPFIEFRIVFFAVNFYFDTIITVFFKQIKCLTRVFSSLKIVVKIFKYIKPNRKYKMYSIFFGFVVSLLYLLWNNFKQVKHSKFVARNNKILIKFLTGTF